MYPFVVEADPINGSAKHTKGSGFLVTPPHRRSPTKYARVVTIVLSLLCVKPYDEPERFHLIKRTGQGKLNHTFMPLRAMTTSTYESNEPPQQV